MEFIEACEELNWNHERSTSRRFETLGFAERTIRRVKEGTSSELLQSGVEESWWAEAMEWVLLFLKCAGLSSRWPDASRTSVCEF